MAERNLDRLGIAGRRETAPSHAVSSGRQAPSGLRFLQRFGPFPSASSAFR
jgi:hypothetical protein